MKQNDEHDYEYLIYVDDNIVWRGLNPEKEYDKIVKANPNKKISIGWELKEGILIAII